MERLYLPEKHPLLSDSLFNIIFILILTIYLTEDDPKKKVFKLARKFQRESDDKITRNVLERICQRKDIIIESVEKTYEILVKTEMEKLNSK